MYIYIYSRVPLYRNILHIYIYIRFGLKIVFVYLYITLSHYHHCASLSEDIELIKCLSDIVCRVCEQDKAYSLSYPLQNTWGCVFSVNPFPLWWLREYIYFVLLSSSNRKYELLPIAGLGLGHETMVYAVCLYVFLWYTTIYYDRSRM